MGLQVHTKFQRNRPNRYRVTAKGTFVGKGCARAERGALHQLLVEGTSLMTPNPHTKFEHNRSSRF